MKRRIILFLRNKYIFTSVIFLGWICFFNDIDLFYIIRTRMDLVSLQGQISEYREKNREAQESLHDLTTNMATLEKFAREQYYMKRENEEVFVFKERVE